MDITNNILNDFSNEFNKDDKNELLKNAVSNNKLKTLVVNRDKIQNRNHVFSKKIDIKTSSSDQKDSGRCWIFALLNLMRFSMIKKYKLDENFEFSSNYLFFYDKLEKSNIFLHNIIKTSECPDNSRIFDLFMHEPVSDGGQWNMLANLVNKYGVIPKSNMNETYASTHSDELNGILNDKLRSFAYEIRSQHNNTKDHIHKYMEEVYRILIIFLGEPPKQITWEYYTGKEDKKKYKVIKNITPLNFYKKHVPYNINNKVCLINFPSKNRPFYRKYDIKYNGNVLQGRNTNYINVPIETIIKACEKSINSKMPIWFGCDINKYSDNRSGILDTELMNYELIFNESLKMNKGDKLNYHINELNHAMIIKGYNKLNGDIDRWLIENSWGKYNETKGEMEMTTSWFENYVIEVVVDKKFLKSKVRKTIKSKPIILDPWDILGNLYKKTRKIYF